MKPLKWILLWPMLLLLSGATANASTGFDWVVRAGETLSQIAFYELEGSVYDSKTGSLKKILALNPWIKSADLIKPGQVIRLPGMPISLAGMEKTFTPVRSPASEAPEPLQCTETGGVSPEELFPKSSFGSSLGFEYFRIDARDRATGGTAEILSGMSPVLKLFWALEWNPEWTSFLRFKLRRERVSSADNRNKAFQEGNGTSFGFEGAVQRNWNENSRSRVEIGRDERLFTRASNAQTIQFDRVGVTHFGLAHDQALIRVKTASAGLGGSAHLLFPASSASYEVNTGYAARALAFIEHDRKALSIRGEVFLEKGSQNSSISDQKTTTTGVSIGLKWSLP